MAPPTVPVNYEQRNLRLRVASTTFQEEEDGLPETYDHATHYSYDIHGNVKEMVQDHPQMALDVGGAADDPMRYKRIQYRYDLISGKVREVKYQEGHHDQFFHRYGYDADNRITKAETSLDGSLWHTDTEYFYYPHGPLQRVELGEQKVQGMDHAYTLQGWLKGINSELLTPENDMGLDGVVGGGNANELVGRDAYGLSLTYHGNDYRAIDNARWDNTNAHRPFAPQAWTTPDWHPLYNGNIAGTVHSLQPFGVGGWQGTAGEVGQALAGLYRYDQLNRLREMRTRAGLNDATNDWTTLPTPTGADAEKYRSSYTYDANGNIRTADRWDQAGAPYDALAYGYKEANGAKLLRNRLYQVDDLADPTNALVNAGPGEQAVDLAYTGPSGFDPQDQNIETAYNYHYDELGNLTHDAAAHIDAIAWTVAGKVRAVDHAAGQGPDLEFAYGAGGQRISKQVGGAVGDPGTYREHYIRDAQGNIMATYRLHPNGAFRVQERPIYGSSRVGLYAGKVDLYPATQLVPMPQVIPVFDALLRYELTDHLGNVGTVVTGRLLPGDGAPHEAEVISAQGYEPFGAMLPGRNYSPDDYRFGFQGQEKDDEMHDDAGTSYDFGARLYDPRVGRWLSLDPKSKANESPYSAFSNSPLYLIDPNGKDTLVMHRSGRIAEMSKGDAEVYLVTFSVIRNKVETALTETMYMVGNRNYRTTQEDRNYPLEFRQMSTHDGDEGWENTIFVAPIGRGVFLHPAGNVNTDLLGCYTLTENQVQQDGSGEWTSGTKAALQKVRDIYNAADGSDGALTGDKFLLQTNSRAETTVDRMETRNTSLDENQSGLEGRKKLKE